MQGNGGDKSFLIENQSAQSNDLYDLTESNLTSIPIVGNKKNGQLKYDIQGQQIPPNPVQNSFKKFKFPDGFRNMPKKSTPHKIKIFITDFKPSKSYTRFRILVSRAKRSTTRKLQGLIHILQSNNGSRGVELGKSSDCISTAVSDYCLQSEYDEISYLYGPSLDNSNCYQNYDSSRSFNLQQRLYLSRRDSLAVNYSDQTMKNLKNTCSNLSGSTFQMQHFYSSRSNSQTSYTQQSQCLNRNPYCGSIKNKNYNLKSGNQSAETLRQIPRPTSRRYKNFTKTNVFKPLPTIWKELVGRALLDQWQEYLQATELNLDYFAKCWNLFNYSWA